MEIGEFSPKTCQCIQTIRGFKFSDLFSLSSRIWVLMYLGWILMSLTQVLHMSFKRLYRTYTTYHLLGFRKIRQGGTLQIIAGADIRKTTPLCVSFLIAASDCIRLYNEVRKYLQVSNGSPIHTLLCCITWFPCNNEQLFNLSPAQWLIESECGDQGGA